MLGHASLELGDVSTVDPVFRGLKDIITSDYIHSNPLIVSTVDPVFRGLKDYLF